MHAGQTVAAQGHTALCSTIRLFHGDLLFNPPRFGKGWQRPKRTRKRERARRTGENAKARRSESAKQTGMGGDPAGSHPPLPIGFRVFALSRFRVLRSAAFAFASGLSAPQL